MNRFLLLFVWALVWPGAVSQAQTDSSPPEFDLFAAEEPLDVTLEFDVKHFIRKKYKDQYQPALITIHLNDSLSVSDTIRIKARGEFRKRHCSFPPIRLNFKRAEFPIASLNQLEKVKLVTHCKGSETYQQYIYKEYLTYKAFNLMTEKSFRVRLVRMNYVDSEGKKDPIQKMGFIIEELDRMAERNGCKEFDQEGVHPELTQREHMTLVALFQFMIGNTDWHGPSLHNIRLIKNQDFQNDEVYSIPYDFDYSGIVDAIYAIPGEELGIESVQQRYYMGFERSQEELAACFQQFFDLEKEIIGLFQNSTYLNEKEKKATVEYLSSFYEIIRDKYQVKVNIQQMAIQR